MQVVSEKIARHHTHNHLIFFTPEDPSTYASAVLLNHYYKDMDIDYSHDNDWRYLFISKRTFIRHQKINGHWTCHYCGKEIFELAKRGKRCQNIKKCVTVDHKKPACEILDKTDSSNFLVSCHHCNDLKGSMSYENFINKHIFIKPTILKKSA